MQYDKSLIKILLGAFVEGKEHYTHHFACFGCSHFTGKDNRAELRKYLNYMRGKGHIEQHKYPHNVHKWSITKDGLEVLQLFNADKFIS